MDASEATRIVMSRIQGFDPENASKIMGYILIQEQGEKEMIRLAFSPDALLLSYINQAKMGLGFSSSNPFIRPENNNPFPQSSPRIMIPNNGFHLSSSPSSPGPLFQRSRTRPISYASVLDRPNIGSPSLHFGDEFMGGGGVGYDELPFLDDPSGVDPVMSPSGNSDSLVFPYGEDVNGVPSPHPHPFHRRSCSVNDAAFLDEGSGGNELLWRPCMYFARGFCKNGGTCKFLHSDFEVNDGGQMGSPSKIAGLDELFKLKALQQQRFSFMMNDSPRGDFSPVGLSGGASSSSRQIYLTFPADSTFKEDDVSNYFSMFGPVQDVRIPYQQKRMFGFVTFLYPETVKLILAKGNPHFVCDSRVLVKPYKEKGKIREKKQHMERGGYSSPSGVDSREHFDQPFGPRMLMSPQELMLKRKLEREAELQHAIELQGQKMMSLQLRDMKTQIPNHQGLPTGVLYSSPQSSQLLTNQHFATAHSINKEDSSDSDGADEKLVIDGSKSSASVLKQGKSNDTLPRESLEGILPDNLFASPTKSAAENQPF